MYWRIWEVFMPEIECRRRLSKSYCRFCFEYLDIVVDNEAAWNYLRGIFKEPMDGKDKPDVREFKEVKERTLGILENHRYSRFVMSFLLFIYENERKNEISDLICKRLESLDTVRKNYWSYRHKHLLKGNFTRDSYDSSIIKQIISLSPVPSTTGLYYISRYAKS